MIYGFLGAWRSLGTPNQKFLEPKNSWKKYNKGKEKWIKYIQVHLSYQQKQFLMEEYMCFLKLTHSVTRLSSGSNDSHYWRSSGFQSLRVRDFEILATTFNMMWICLLLHSDISQWSLHRDIVIVAAKNWLWHTFTTERNINFQGESKENKSAKFVLKRLHGPPPILSMDLLVPSESD